MVSPVAPPVQAANSLLPELLVHELRERGVDASFVSHPTAGAVSAGGTELAGTYEKEISISAAGTYYLGVFETSGMAYSNVVATVGYYSTAYEDSTPAYNSMMMPSGITVTNSRDYDLYKMMAMKMAMGGM